MGTATETEVKASWDDPASMAPLCANNHAKFECFMWMSEPADSERYWLWNIECRDSGLVAQSNADAIRAEMLKLPGVYEESHSHWAVGHTECLVVPVYRKDMKTLTKAFLKACELQARLDDYPLLDETDHSNREYESTIENIESEAHGLVKANAPDDWAPQVFSWLWDNNQGAVESRDDQGGYPNKEELRMALEALRMIDPSESSKMLEDFPIGTVVMVGEPGSETAFWETPFVGLVIAHDTEGEMLVVQACSGFESFAVMPGEIVESFVEDKDQLQLFYFMTQTKEYYSWEEWTKWKETYMAIQAEIENE